MLYTLGLLQAEADDRCWRIRPLITAFNDLHKKVICPGYGYCAWTSWYPSGKGCDMMVYIFRKTVMPHVTKTSRKPALMGSEMNALAWRAAQATFMLWLEIMEKVKRYERKTERKKIAHKLAKTAGTALTLRALENFISGHAGEINVSLHRVNGLSVNMLYL